MPRSCATSTRRRACCNPSRPGTINAAMAALPEELRSAILLREIEGLSYEEIAEAMSCPIGTVRSRIFRAREAVAEKLRPLLDTSPDRGGNSAEQVGNSRAIGERRTE
jgi:predicted DNA-binding protein (UPF0251 family)